jgi:ATP-dependent Clp protease ATP-binding subunit ClpA
VLFASIKKRVAERGIEISLSEDAKAYIGEEGFDLVYGARPLKRALYEEIEDRLADMILRDEIDEGSSVSFDVEDGQIVAKIG